MQLPAHRVYFASRSRKIITDSWLKRLLNRSNLNQPASTKAGALQFDSNPVQLQDPTVQVRVAAARLPAGLLLRSEDLDWKPLPKSQVPSGAIIEGNRAADEITGVMVRREVAEGAPVLERDIIRPNAPGFLSAVLKPGMRAVSVAVDSVSGNAGLIQPGDYVDMILVQQASGRDSGGFGFPESEAKAHSVVSETVVEKARVIAVGSEFLQYEQETSERKDTGRTAARTVTLEVKPRAAEAIAVAARLGTITLALRSFAVTDRDAAVEDAGVTWDGDQNAEGPLWAGDVSRAIASTSRHAAPVAESGKTPAAAPVYSQPRNITIYRGSDQSTQTLGAAGGR